MSKSIKRIFQINNDSLFISNSIASVSDNKHAYIDINQTLFPQNKNFIPKLIISDSSLIVGLVLGGFMLILIGIVGIRYMKKKIIRDPRNNQAHRTQNSIPAFVIQENLPRPPEDMQIQMPRSNLRREIDYHSQQYIQHDNNIFLEHTIVVNSFPSNPRSGLTRPNNNIYNYQNAFEAPSNGINPVVPLELLKENKELPPKEDLNPDVRCVICWEQEANMIFAPCAHKCCCTKDAWYIVQNNKTCPMCRNKIDGIINSTLKNANENLE